MCVHHMDAGRDIFACTRAAIYNVALLQLKLALRFLTMRGTACGTDAARQHEEGGIQQVRLQHMRISYIDITGAGKQCC
jgi:hypothetical protein